MKNIIQILFILHIFSLGQAKFYQQDISIDQFNSSRWHYLTKFGAHRGKSTYKARNSFEIIGNDQNSKDKVKNVYLRIFLDEEWEKMDLQNFCDYKDKSTIHQSVPFYISSQNKAEIKDGDVSQHIRQHLWFFVLEDCDSQIYKHFQKMNTKNIKLRVTFELLNSGESHFSSEESGIIYYIGFCCFITTFILIQSIKLIRKDYKKNEEIDSALVWLLVTISIEVLQNYFNFIHLISYSNNGYGIAGFQLISEILQAISRFSLQSLIILISWGWTINYIELESFDFYLPLGLVIAYLQILIMALGKLTDDSHLKYHHFDGWIGILICVIEIALFIYFYFGIQNTIKKANENIKSFAIQLKCYSTLYFLCFPTFLIISKILAPYLRFKFIMIGTSLTRLLAILLFLGLLTSSKSEYSKISYKNQGLLDRIKNQ